ncbi:hypothetical protein DP939_21980 [Spongiactinospora rosea]|uniref:Leucine rich repeat (LRR) protein n=1 Tax=Spongiactinospora rosea TaxID=2248750 RepID=A0A366LWK1_9ACTN|nr:hypothetical protein [Spongiactinospora rosea]RBQ18137.1 hypothetical protein DP939_21980 [Spongiactinospora rosea]
MSHLRCGLAANPALPGDLVDRLIATADEDTAGHLANRTDLSHGQAVALLARDEETAAALAERGLLVASDIDPAAQPHAALALLAAATGRPEWARRLAADPGADRREELAACPGLPPDVRETLAADTDVRVVAELALWTTSPDLAAELALHPQATVRRAVATNESTPPAVLAWLLTSKGALCLGSSEGARGGSCESAGCHEIGCGQESAVHGIWLMALSNPATPAAAVIPFGGHPSMLLRAKVAARPGLPPEVYERLASSPEPGVRSALAENPGIGEEVTRVLAADTSNDVRRGLAHNPCVPLGLLVRLAGVTKIGSALLPRVAAASSDEVAELAAAADPAVRMLVAERRDLRGEIRDALAVDPDAKVVKAVAPHPGLPDVLLRAMVARFGAQVVAQVARNPDATPGLLEDLVLHGPPVRKAFREVARHPHATAAALLACLSDRRARPIAAGHPALPAQVIVELLADDDWEVAEAAAANPTLPAAVMRRLAT